MSDWFIDQLGLPWYALVWPQVVLGLGLLWLLLKLLARWVPLRWWQRWALALPIAFIAVNWDVWLVSREANRLCREQGGLHVYKTVEAEGLAGETSIKYWSQYGFTYVDGGGKRYTLVGDEEHVEPVPEGQRARYGAGTYENYAPVAPRIHRSGSHVIDLETGEELGKHVTFSIGRSWADRWLPGLLPMEHTPWICGKWVPEELQDRYGKTYGVKDLIIATVIPTNQRSADEK